MIVLRYSFGALLFLGAAACGSSSSGSPATGGEADSSTDSSVAGDDGGTPAIMATCGLLSGIGGGGTAGTCPMGQTCCTMLALPPSASCLPPSECTGMSISNECSKGSDCPSGQVCCGGSPDGGSMMMMLPAADAAAGLGGLGGFDTSQFNTTCQTSCAPSQTQECAMDSECPTGQTCQSPPGAAALGSVIMLPKDCAVPVADSGTTPVVDSGTTPPVVDAAAEAESTTPMDAASE
jgi:hypothetical protein